MKKSRADALLGHKARIKVQRDTKIDENCSINSNNFVPDKDNSQPFFQTSNFTPNRNMKGIGQFGANVNMNSNSM
jgi:hypothetical protein